VLNSSKITVVLQRAREREEGAQSSPSSSSSWPCDWSVPCSPNKSSSLTLADSSRTERVSPSETSSEDASRVAEPLRCPPRLRLRCWLDCVLSSLSSSEEEEAAALPWPLPAPAPARFFLASRRPPAHTQNASQSCILSLNPTSVC
jgi:hypothetical protein